MTPRNPKTHPAVGDTAHYGGMLVQIVGMAQGGHVLYCRPAGYHRGKPKTLQIPIAAWRREARPCA